MNSGDRSVRIGPARAEFPSLAASPAILALVLLSFLAVTSGGCITDTVLLLTNGYAIGLDTANLTLTGMFVAGAVMTLGGGDLSDRFPPGPIIAAMFATVGALVVPFGSLTLPG